MTDLSSTQNLALYHYQSCPFCRLARTAIDQLDLDIEERDIQRQPQHRSDLIRQGGKPQVPCLRIENESGKVQWLYESSDIISYLKSYTEQAA